MVVTIPSSASSTAFPSSREKTRGNSCVGGRRSRVIALSVCLRDSACLRRSSARKPCTFGTHLRVLQSFLRPRFAYAALVLLRRCGRAALPFARAPRHSEGLTEILTRPLYALTRRRSTTISLNVTRCPRNVAMPRNVATGAPSQWLRDAYECDPGVVPVLDWRQRKRNAKERDRHEQVRQAVGLRGNPGGR